VIQLFQGQKKSKAMTIKNEAPVTSVLVKGAVVTSLFCLLLSGCGKEEAAPPPETARPVKTIVLAGGGTAERRQYPGRVRAASRADLSFEVAGKLAELPVKEGQVIEKGDLVARLDDRDLSADLKSARAENENAEANFQRGAKLVKDGFISKTDFDKLRAQRDVTAAVLTRAEKAVEDTRLLAPFSGRVASRLVENFQDVQAKQPILKLQDVDQLEILIDVPENRAIRMKQSGGQPPKLDAVFEAAPGREFPLEVKEFSTEANPDTQTFEAVLSMPQPEGLTILPGMTAMVWAQPPEGNAGIRGDIIIPASAIFADEAGKTHVWVVDTQSNTVQKRAIETGDLSGADGVRVVDGLEAGEMLAVSAVSRLREGMAIKPVDQVEF